MKRIAYSFFLIALMSCGSSLDSRKQNHIIVKFHDSAEKEFLLLSVREDKVVVAPYFAEGEILYGSLAASAEAIPFSRIERISSPHESNYMPILRGGLAGCFCGGVAGFALYYDAYLIVSNKYNYAPYIGIATGLPVGMLIGYLLRSGDSFYSLTSKTDIGNLRQRAFFENEPPELQKIQ